tara:strand:+ start:562 stop:1191 length:630 start_codon:yes stop_codon:yes gene_type:complete
LRIKTKTMKDKMEEMQAYLSLQKEIGKTSKLKSLKRSTATIIPQKKGIGNMFKTDYYIDHLIGKFSITYVDKRKFFNYVKSLFFNERYEWSIKKYKVFITDNNIDSQNICTVLVELSNSDYVLEGKKMKGFLAFITKVKALNLQDKQKTKIANNDPIEFLKRFREFSNKHLKFNTKKEYIEFIDKNFETGYTYNTLYSYLMDSKKIDID